jgi:hypothetical protein
MPLTEDSRGHPWPQDYIQRQPTADLRRVAREITAHIRYYCGSQAEIRPLRRTLDGIQEWLGRVGGDAAEEQSERGGEERSKAARAHASRSSVYGPYTDETSTSRGGEPTATQRHASRPSVNGLGDMDSERTRRGGEERQQSERARESVRNLPASVRYGGAEGPYSGSSRRSGGYGGRRRMYDSDSDSDLDY